MFRSLLMSLRGLVGPSGPDDAPGVVPFAVLLLPAGVQAFSACPNPPAVGLNVHPDRFHREIGRSVLLPNTPTEIGRPDHGRSESAPGLCPCRQSVPPSHTELMAADTALGFVLFQVFGHPPMDACKQRSTIAWAISLRIPPPAPFRSWAFLGQTRQR